MTSRNRRRTQAADIKRRAKEPSLEPPRKCLAMGCGRLTQRSSGKGLSERYCKNHQEHYRRHGSYWRRSYWRHELEPYRAASRKWLKAHQEDQVQRAIIKLDLLIETSGQTESAHSLKGLRPVEKARVALARLKEAGKRGEDLMEITLTIKATMSDIGPRGDPEFQYVQIAKMAHRLASGTHRTTSGFVIPSKYPRAEGIFMRILGERIEEIAGIVADREAVQEVIAIRKTERKT